MKLKDYVKELKKKYPEKVKGMSDYQIEELIVRQTEGDEKADRIYSKKTEQTTQRAASQPEAQSSGGLPKFDSATLKVIGGGIAGAGNRVLGAAETGWKVAGKASELASKPFAGIKEFAQEKLYGRTPEQTRQAEQESQQWSKEIVPKATGAIREKAAGVRESLGIDPESLGYKGGKLVGGTAVDYALLKQFPGNIVGEKAVASKAITGRTLKGAAEGVGLTALRGEEATESDYGWAALIGGVLSGAIESLTQAASSKFAEKNLPKIYNWFTKADKNIKNIEAEANSARRLDARIASETDPVKKAALEESRRNLNPQKVRETLFKSGAKGNMDDMIMQSEDAINTTVEKSKSIASKIDKSAKEPPIEVSKILNYVEDQKAKITSNTAISGSVEKGTDAVEEEILKIWDGKEKFTFQKLRELMANVSESITGAKGPRAFQQPPEIQNRLSQLENFYRYLRKLSRETAYKVNPELGKQYMEAMDTLSNFLAAKQGLIETQSAAGLKPLFQDLNISRSTVPGGVGAAGGLAAGGTPEAAVAGATLGVIGSTLARTAPASTAAVQGIRRIGETGLPATQRFLQTGAVQAQDYLNKDKRYLR